MQFVYASNGDMFDGNAMPPSSRSWVAPEDPMGRSDLFIVPSQQGPNDMYGRPPPSNSTEEQNMLNSHLNRTPDDPLFKAPKNGIYPVQR